MTETPNEEERVDEEAVRLQEPGSDDRLGDDVLERIAARRIKDQVDEP
jgi:hypothetical protein